MEPYLARAASPSIWTNYANLKTAKRSNTFKMTELPIYLDFALKLVTDHLLHLRLAKEFHLRVNGKIYNRKLRQTPPIPFSLD